MTINLFAKQVSGLLSPAPSQAYLEESYAPEMLAAIGTLFGLAMICVLLRVYVRVVMLKVFGVDDWLMMLSAVLSVACFSSFAALTHVGVGHHVEYFTYVRPDHRKRFFEISWWYAWILVAAYSSIKISIACFLLRFADHRRHWQWSLYAMIVILILFTIGSVLSLVLQCLPIQAAWDFNLRPPTGNANCYSTTTFRNTGVFNSVFNLATDLILALSPIPIIWKIQTDLRTKISLCIVMGLGLFTCGVAAYKIPLQFHFFDEKDFLGRGAWYYVWQQYVSDTIASFKGLPS
ncbi:hypothetical protein AALT_g5880 [Alternaria alternata]|nr:hypothetical protein AALT_g5880 [Alternaria alternata]